MSWLELAAAGAGALGNFFTGQANKKAQQEENQKNRDFNLRMWNLNNQYNLPINQMQRLKDAGISPHLAYSNGQPMNTSNAPASSSASSTMPMNMGIGELANLILASAQTKKIEAETDKIKEDTETSKITNLHLSDKFKSEIDANNMNVKVGESQIQVNTMNIDKGYKELEKIGVEIDELNKKIELYGSQMSLNAQQIEHLKATIGLIGIQGLKLYQDIRESKSRIQVNNSQIRVNNSTAKVNYQLANKLATENYILHDQGLYGAKLNNHLVRQNIENLKDALRTASEQRDLMSAQTYNTWMDTLVKGVDVIFKVLDEVQPYGEVVETASTMFGDGSKTSHTTRRKVRGKR